MERAIQIIKNCLLRICASQNTVDYLPSCLPLAVKSANRINPYNSSLDTHRLFFSSDIFTQSYVQPVKDVVQLRRKTISEINKNRIGKALKAKGQQYDATSYKYKDLTCHSA